MFTSNFRFLIFIPFLYFWDFTKCTKFAIFLLTIISTVVTKYNIFYKNYLLINNNKKLISQKITIVFSFFRIYRKRKLCGKLVSYSQITDFKLVAKNVCFMLNFLSISVSDIWDIYDCIKVLFRDVGSFL